MDDATSAVLAVSPMADESSALASCTEVAGAIGSGKAWEGRTSPNGLYGST